MKRPLVFAAGGFVLGEVWLLLPVVWKAAAPALLGVGVCCLESYKKRERKESMCGSRLVLYRVLPFLLAGILGAGRLQLDRRISLGYEETVKRAEALDDNSAVWLEGRAADIRPGNGETYEAVLQLSHVRLHFPDEQAPFGSVLVYLEERPDRRLVRIGGKVAVKGELEGLGRASNPGQFDYESYYHALGIEGRMFGKELKVLGNDYSPYRDGILVLKERAAGMLERLCVPGDRGIFRALLLGDRTALSDDIYEMYQKNGIAHILAVSGLHISLIGLGMYRLLRRAGAGFGLSGLWAAAFTVSYGILTGSSASVVRAVLMICFQILADWLGRTYDMMSAMAAAALALLLRSPSLLFQAGFQLSFGAILAVGAVLPVLDVWLGGNFGGGRLAADSFLASVRAGLAIQIVTFPIIVSHFYEYPVYGFFLNLLVIPLMAYVVMSGIAGILLGTVWLPAGRFFVGTGHYILKFYEQLCLMVQRLPGAVRIVGRPKMWQICVYGAVWAVILGWAMKKVGKCEDGQAEKDYSGDRFVGRCACRYVLAAAGLLCGFLILRPLPPQGLKVTFLDVGQGDGICLETRDTVILVDGGSSSNRKLGEQVLEPFLKSSGISVIDYAVVSHGDEDHISGLRYLLETDCGIDVKCLVLPRLGQGDDRYGGLVSLAKQSGAGVVWMGAGGQITGEEGNERWSGSEGWPRNGKWLGNEKRLGSEKWPGNEEWLESETWLGIWKWPGSGETADRHAPRDVTK